MSDLKLANALIREGRNREALDIFSRLLHVMPGFVPYAQGYALALKRLGETVPIDTGEQSVYVREAIHPQSKDIASDLGRLFVVVTPVLNGEKFLEASLTSVLNQAGDFFIDYFIKDAGSTDNTLGILFDYQQQISAGIFPLRCNGIRFRVESSPDQGLYDAVAYGFGQGQQRGDPADIFTYINADDAFVEDAFRIVVQVMGATPARWICGQTNVIDENDKVLSKPKFPLTYAREDIRAGLHDGRSLYFIQQEGSFWLRELYDTVGGLNRALKLAGDFDLWRRFASHTELLALSINLASFRSRPGQMSSQIDKYYTEVDSLTKEQDVSAPHESVSPTQDTPFFWGKNNFPHGKHQHPGPICFLTEDKRIHEIAYLRRTWLGW